MTPVSPGGRAPFSSQQPSSSPSPLAGGKVRQKRPPAAAERPGDRERAAAGRSRRTGPARPDRPFVLEPCSDPPPASEPRPHAPIFSIATGVMPPPGGCPSSRMRKRRHALLRYSIRHAVRHYDRLAEAFAGDGTPWSLCDERPISNAAVESRRWRERVAGHGYRSGGRIARGHSPPVSPGERKSSFRVARPAREMEAALSPG